MKSQKARKKPPAHSQFLGEMVGEAVSAEQEETVKILAVEVQAASPAEIEKASDRIYNKEATLEVIKARSDLEKARSKSLNDAAKREETKLEGSARRAREDKQHLQNLSQQRFRFYASWTIAISGLVGSTFYLVYGENDKVKDYSLDFLKIAFPAIVAYVIGRIQGNSKPGKKDDE